jgi:hypothetical protein
MFENAHNTTGGSGIPSGDDLPPPSQMTHVEIFMATQMEVLRQFVTPDFSKETKCITICMPGSSFMHIVTYKCIQK